MRAEQPRTRPANGRLIIPSGKIIFRDFIDREKWYHTSPGGSHESIEPCGDFSIRIVLPGHKAGSCVCGGGQIDDCGIVLQTRGRQVVSKWWLGDPTP